MPQTSWPTVADTIAHMRDHGTIRPEDQTTALLLDEVPTPLPLKLSLANVLALLRAERANPSDWFAKRFRNAAISLAMSYENAQRQAAPLGAACGHPPFEFHGRNTAKAIPHPQRP